MSRENMEIVRRLQPPPDIDLVALFGDGAESERLLAAVEPFFHDDFVTTGGIQIGEGVGLEGLKQGWADWLEPWESYRTEIEEMIDLGDDVLVLVRDYGRRAGMSAEISVLGGAVWTVRDGKIARVRFYPDRDAALEAVGLRE